MSLTCTNCPDVVQALNLLALSNPRITHTAVDGALFPEEVARLNIQAVPAVFHGEELIHVAAARWPNCWTNSRSASALRTQA